MSAAEAVPIHHSLLGHIYHYAFVLGQTGAPIRVGAGRAAQWGACQEEAEEADGCTTLEAVDVAM